MSPDPVDSVAVRSGSARHLGGGEAAHNAGYGGSNVGRTGEVHLGYSGQMPAAVIATKPADLLKPLGNTQTVFSISVQKQRRRERDRRRRGVQRLGVLPALDACGLEPSGANVAITMLDGVAHVAGVKTCGSVWACPVCGAKIRHARSLEVAGALGQAERLGMGLAMLTLTVRHHQGDALESLWRRQEAAWERLQQSKAWRVLRDEIGLVGMITAREVTYGEHGWHPHRHVQLVLDAPAGAGRLEEWGARLATAWLHQLARQGLSAVGRWAVDVVPVSGAGVARYLEKIEPAPAERPGRAALELVRGDLKAGRHGSLTPEQLAEMVCDGEAEAVRLWSEFARVSKGRRFLTWTRGLRERLAVPESLTDEEIAGAEVGGEVVAVVTAPGWWRLVGAGAVVHTLEAAEAGRDVLAAGLAADLRPGEWWIIDAFA